MTLDFQRLAALVHDWKTLAYTPAHWNHVPHKRSTKLEMVLPLERGGITESGLALRITALREIPDGQVTAQLEYEPAGRKRISLQRLDWRPIRPHANSMDAPGDLQLAHLTGSHVHEFDANRAIGERAFNPQGNLPVARPLDPDPRTFEELLEILREQFRIGDVERIPVPPWEAGLGV